jgi:hypothetical protein
VEASEAIRRIFWRHRWLLLILVIVPAAAVAVKQLAHPVTYTATASVQGQGTTPDTTTQVSAIQSRVTAVATNPAVVQQAITAAGVDRNATDVARHEISVTPLGTSAVMALTITDPGREVALRLTAELGTIVVSQLNQLGITDNPELSALNKSVVQLTARRDELVTKLDAATSSGVASTSVQAQSLLAELSATEQQLATTEATSQQVLTSLSANTGASLVSSPSSATQASRHVLAYGALAALLGLVIGLLFASLREVARPTVAEPAAGARELGAIPLGDAELRGDQVNGIDDELAGRLTVAARRVGAGTVVLTGPVSGTRLDALARRLNTELSSPPLAPARPRSDGDWLAAPLLASAGPPGDGPAVLLESGPPTVVTLRDIRLGDGRVDAALVVALPRFAPHSSLDQAADLSLATDWPVLGVIGLRQSRWHR